MSTSESRDESNDPTISKKGQHTSRASGPDKSAAVSPVDLDKLGQIVDEIMEWRNKAAECCGTETLFADRFKLLDELGSGGFGIVYHALDEQSPATATDGQRKPVAMKVLSLQPDHETSGAQRPVSPEKWGSITKLIAELAIQEDASEIVGCIPMKSCDAPGSKDDLDAMLTFVRESPIWFSMPVCKCNLAEHLETNGGTLSPDEAVRIMSDVAKALQGLHSYGDDGGIIHRDLKPQNILLMHGDVPVVADYGLSVRGFDQRVAGNPNSGTEVYMSPEQIEGSAMTAQSDIWSWGVILYQLISGKLPFGGEDIAGHIRNSNFRSLDAAAPGVVTLDRHRYLVDIVDRCLRKKGTTEFSSFAEVLEALKSPTIPPGVAEQFRGDLGRVETKVGLVQETLSTDREEQKKAVDRLIKKGWDVLKEGGFDEAERLCVLAIDQSVVMGDEELEFKSRLALAHVRYEGNSDVSTAGPAMHALQRFAEQHADNSQVQCETKLMVSQWSFRSGRLDEAEVMIRDALEIAQSLSRPKAIRTAAHLMCWIARARRDLSLFRQYLEIYEKNDGDLLDGAVLRADLAAIEGDKETEIRETQRILSGDFGPVAAVMEYGLRLTLSRSLCQLERHDEAYSATHASGRLNEGDPFSLELRLLKAQLECQRGDVETAINELTLVSNLAKNNGIRAIEAEGQLTQCRLFLDTGRFDSACASGFAAQTAFRATSGRDGTGLVESMRLTAVALDRVGQGKQAKELFDEALAVAIERKTPDEQQWVLRLQLAHMLLSQGEFDEAREMLPSSDLLQSMPPETVKEFESLKIRVDTGATVHGQLLELVTTDEPLRLAETESAFSINEAHQKVICDLLEWTDEFPEMAAKAIDFWGRGSFARLLLNHRGFGFDHTFHLTAEVSTLEDAGRAVRILAPLCDCLTLLWKGPLVGQLSLFAVPLDYKGAGGWGYDICGGSEMTQEGKKRMVPVMGMGNYLPDEVARFFVQELRPLVASGRVLVLPAFLVGCISRDHGPFERMFSEMMHAQPILQRGNCDVTQSISLMVPYFENAPFDDLAKIIEDEQESLLALRSVLVHVATQHLKDGPVLSANASRDIREEIRSGVAQVEAKLRRLVRKLPDDIYTLQTTEFNSEVISQTARGTLDSVPNDEAVRQLIAMADRGDMRASPWYAVWRMKQAFGRPWSVAGPILDGAGPPKINQVEGAFQHKMYHWLHPPKLDVVQRRCVGGDVIVGRD